MSNQQDDVYSTLLSPTLRNDIASFVGSHFQFALLSPQPLYALQHRLQVILVGLNKAGMPAQHESFAIWVRDRVTNKCHEFIIERAPSEQRPPKPSARFSLFSNSSDSPAILETIRKAITNTMRYATSEAADSFFVPLSVEEDLDSIPLLPLTNNSETPPNPDIHPSPHAIPMSFIDTITTTLAGSVASARRGSRSSSPQHLAVDSITALSPETLVPVDCIRRFEPVDLCLFDLVLLARVVHDHAPIYGLFDNQCYMFACVIFDAVVQLHSLPSATLANPSLSTSHGPVPAPTREVGAPGNANTIIFPHVDQSGQSGRWGGLLILDPSVKATIVSIVIEKFNIERKALVDRAETTTMR